MKNSFKEEMRWEELAKERHLQEHLDKHLGKGNDEEYIQMASKWIFTMCLLKQLGSLSTDIYKCQTRSDYLKESQKKKGAPLKHHAAQLRQEACEKKLVQSLKSFDNAQFLFEWLERDFDLSYQHVAAYTEVVDIQNRVDKLRDVSIMQPAKMDQAKQAISKLKEKIQNHQQELDKGEKQRLNHERALLAVALNYFDVNNNKTIESEDMPNLPANLFNLLDRNCNHSISSAELLSTIEYLSSSINASKKTIEQQKESFETVLTQKIQTEQKLLGLSEVNKVQELEDDNASKLRLKLKKELEQRTLKVQATQKNLNGEKRELIEKEQLKEDILYYFKQGLITEVMSQTNNISQMNVASIIRDQLKQGTKIKDIHIGQPETHIKLDPGLNKNQQEALQRIIKQNKQQPPVYLMDEKKEHDEVVKIFGIEDEEKQKEIYKGLDESQHVLYQEIEESEFEKRKEWERKREMRREGSPFLMLDKKKKKEEPEQKHLEEEKLEPSEPAPAEQPGLSGSIISDIQPPPLERDVVGEEVSTEVETSGSQIEEIKENEKFQKHKDYDDTTEEKEKQKKETEKRKEDKETEKIIEQRVEEKEELLDQLQDEMKDDARNLKQEEYLPQKVKKKLTEETKEAERYEGEGEDERESLLSLARVD